MTGPREKLMGRADLERAFNALGERLARRGVVADVFVVGGAAVCADFYPDEVMSSRARGVIEDLFG